MGCGAFCFSHGVHVEIACEEWRPPTGAVALAGEVECGGFGCRSLREDGILLLTDKEATGLVKEQAMPGCRLDGGE